jgi:hypothetical protein
MPGRFTMLWQTVARAGGMDKRGESRDNHDSGRPRSTAVAGSGNDFRPDRLNTRRRNRPGRVPGGQARLPECASRKTHQVRSDLSM